jgi:OmcA/MtrC family decaheme c-type cytochrome
MRRITLAVALVGAVAASGCGGASKPSTTGNKGTAGTNFNVTVNNQGQGTVTSVPPGINCSAPMGTDGSFPAGCSATFASGTAVVLTGTPIGTNYFNGFFGACSGNSCSLAGDADKYVVAYFSATPQVHPNFNDGNVHGPAWTAYTLDCKGCHGANAGKNEDYTKNVGLGIAIACSNCHRESAPAVAVGEKCVKCHLASGSSHQARYDAYADGIDPATTKFAVSDVSVAITDSATAGKKKATVTFTLKKGGQPFTAAPSTLKQKTVYFVSYDATAKKFPTPAYNQGADVDPDGTIGGQDAGSVVNFSFGSMTAVANSPGVFTMVKDGLSSDPVAAATNAFVYGYFGDTVLPSLEGNANPGGRHYALMDNMISFSKILKGTIGYASTATVSGCERCHGKPYSKHGYRQATVAGLNDFVACKACHTDFRRGTDAAWYLLVDDPTSGATGTVTAAQKAKYAYTANAMQDTHNSHAMEFAYPQSMANCTVCHEGKLDQVLTDANFVGTVCKSCHPTTNPANIEGRAPSFAAEPLKTALQYHAFNWVAVYDANGALVGPAGTIKETDAQGVVSYVDCNECHADNIADGNVPGAVLPPTDPKASDGKGPILFGAQVPLFKDIHNGFNPAIYDAAGQRYASTASSKISSIVVDKAAKKVTVVFSVAGAPTGASIKPTVVGSIYGFNTKDFIIGGHSSTGSPSKRVLEYTEGASNNGPRLTVAGGTGSGPWTATFDLSDAAVFPQVADGSSTKMEVGFLPLVTLTDGTSIAIAGLTATIDFTVDGPALPVAGQYGKDIVDAAKCNKCHDALGTTFHSPAYGSAGVVGCRLCHVIGSAGGHLEMQSRSIDSYVHAIHSYQAFDIGNIHFEDAVAKMEYEEHINSIYPNFSIQNCESCHNPGTYDVPNQKLSLASMISKSATLTGTNSRAISGVPAAVVGPASRACGSCHRSKLINEDNAAALTAFEAHVGGDFAAGTGNGYRVTGANNADATAAEMSTVIAGLKAAGFLP